ncbi:MAG: rhomboid family intramembrane serine protease [Ilumatobacteraceae bacterium]
MPGRYQFSVPERRQRDGWFRIGTLDVTTTTLMVLLGVVSMFVYAFDKEWLVNLIFDVPDVRDGDVWRLVTWPVVNPPTEIWVVLTLVFFWFFGHRVEDEIGRKRFTWLILAMTVVPAAIVTALGFDALSSATYGLTLLSVGLLVIFALDNPGAMFFFNIPAWIIALVIVGIDVLRQLGDRLYGQLVMELLLIAVGLFGARQCGMVDVAHWIPRLGSGGQRRAVSSGRPKRGKQLPASPSSVITGPWGAASGPSPTDQIELDTLLDKISATGMDSLSRQEKQRLNELSKRLRGG